MTCEPRHSAFHQKVLPASTLVLVDLCKANLPKGLQRSPGSTIVQNCHQALLVARRLGWRVAHVRSAEALGNGGNSPSISGFEPDRADAMFERRTLSCYSSPYFQSVMQETGGSFVLAGFLGNGGALATLADSVRLGDQVTLLLDASLDDASRRVFTEQVVAQLSAYVALGFNLVTTFTWLRAMEAVSAIAPVCLDARKRRPSPKSAKGSLGA